MGFVACILASRDEVLADFQQYYGIALPLEEEDEPPDFERMAVLWNQLPAESRTARTQAPELEWDAGEYLLWQIEYRLRELVWAMSDRKKRGARPQPLSTPQKMTEARKKQRNALASKDELDRKLAKIGMGGMTNGN